MGDGAVKPNWVLRPASKPVGLQNVEQHVAQWADACAGATKIPKYVNDMLENWNTWTQYAEKHASAEAPDRQLRNDSWTNALTGVGTFRDKLTATTFCGDGQLSFGTLEALYHNDDMAARICDAAPEQMLREGYAVKIAAPDKKKKANPARKALGLDPPEDDSEALEEGTEKETASAIQDALDALDVTVAFTDGQTWGNLYGGGAVLVGADDGQDPSLPLNEANIKSLEFLTVLDRYSLYPTTWYTNPAKKNFGQPETYRILTPTTASPFGITDMIGMVIHESRIIRFGGARTSLRRRRNNLGWDDSVLQRVYSTLQMFAMNWASTAALMADASQGVYSIKGLYEMIVSNQKDALIERMAMVDKERSSGRMLLTDASEGESFTRVPTPFAGIPDLLDRSAARLAAAAKMPVTILFGTSPQAGGLSASGESDLRGWYDQLKGQRSQTLKPKFTRLMRLICLAKNGPTGGVVPPGMCVEFPPLWQQTAAEQATTRLADAQASDIYLTQGVYTAEEVAKSRFGDDYSPDIRVDLEARKDLLETDSMAKRLTVKAGPEELPPPVDPNVKPVPGAKKPAPAVKKAA